MDNQWEWNYETDSVEQYIINDSATYESLCRAAGMNSVHFKPGVMQAIEWAMRKLKEDDPNADLRQVQKKQLAGKLYKYYEEHAKTDEPS